MSVIDTKATLDAVSVFLAKQPWLNDPKSGENSAKLNLMCMAGLHIGETDDGSKYGKMQFTGEHAECVIAIAKAKVPESRIAHDALCAVADDLTSREKSLPIELQRYIVAAAQTSISRKSGRKRGGSKFGNIMRDEAIYYAVQMGVKMGLKRTRNVATDKESACTIASEALKCCGIDLEEATVSTIYDNRHAAHKQAGLAAKKSWLDAGQSEEIFKSLMRKPY